MIILPDFLRMPFCSALVSGRLRAKSKHISSSFRLPGTKVADDLAALAARRGELHVVAVDQLLLQPHRVLFLDGDGLGFLPCGAASAMAVLMRRSTA